MYVGMYLVGGGLQWATVGLGGLGGAGCCFRKKVAVRTPPEEAWTQPTSLGLSHTVVHCAMYHFQAQGSVSGPL